jgi:mevalonate kinase
VNTNYKDIAKATTIFLSGGGGGGAGIFLKKIRFWIVTEKNIMLSPARKKNMRQ